MSKAPLLTVMALSWQMKMLITEAVESAAVKVNSSQACD